MNEMQFLFGMALMAICILVVRLSKCSDGKETEEDRVRATPEYKALRRFLEGCSLKEMSEHFDREWPGLRELLRSSDEEDYGET